MTEHRGPVIRIHYKEKNALYQAHMSFIKDGALYVPLSRELPPMGSHIFLLVELPDSPQLFPASGRVCWISNGRKKGVGVRLDTDVDSKTLRIAIVNATAGSIGSTAATLTM